MPQDTHTGWFGVDAIVLRVCLEVGSMWHAVNSSSGIVVDQHSVEVRQVKSIRPAALTTAG